MDTKKIFLLTFTFLSLAFFTGTVRSASDASPWDSIRASIQNLQNQIDNIQLLPGPTGMQGPQGIQGPGGIFPSIYTKMNTVIVPPRSEHPSVTTNTVYCDAGDKILSGGWSMDYQGFDIIENGELFPTYEYNAWHVSVFNEDENPKNLLVSIRCADTNP